VSAARWDIADSTARQDFSVILYFGIHATTTIIESAMDTAGKESPGSDNTDTVRPEILRFAPFGYPYSSR
jgi:hypothetical protein